MDNNIFDIVVISLTLLLGLKGLIGGFMRELFALVGIIGGAYFASKSTVTLQPIISSNFLVQDDTAILISFIVVFLGFWLIANYVGNIISKLFNASGIGFINNILGFIFASGKIFLFLSIITFATSNLNIIDNFLKTQTTQSKVYPLLLDTGKMILNKDIGLSTQNITNQFIKQQ